MANARQDLGPVVLDRLAGTAAVAALAAGEVDARSPSAVTLEAGGHALERHAQGRSVRLAGGQEAEPAHLGLRGDAGRLALGRLDPLGSSRRQGALHDLERRRLAGPQAEGGGALVEQHRRPIGHRRAVRGGIAQQPGPAVDQVEHEQVGRDDLGRGWATRRRAGRSRWR